MDSLEDREDADLHSGDLLLGVGTVCDEHAVLHLLVPGDEGLEIEQDSLEDILKKSQVGSLT